MHHLYQLFQSTIIENNIVVNSHIETIRDDVDDTTMSVYIGRGLYDPKTSKAYANIPKCASNTIATPLVHHHEWKEYNWIDEPVLVDRDYFVVLRDPITRWKGSAIELCYHFIEHDHMSLDNFEGWFYHQKMHEVEKYFDIHFIRQIDYLIGLDLSKCTFAFFENNLDRAIADFFGNVKFENLNTTSDNKNKQKVKPYIDALMTESFIDELKEFYKKDYELFDLVKKEYKYLY